jgi:hypothetical protein
MRVEYERGKVDGVWEGGLRGRGWEGAEGGARRPNVNGLGPVDSPRPSRRRHRRAHGLPFQPTSCQGGFSISDTVSLMKRTAMLPVAEQDVRPPHRGGSDGVSCVCAERRRCPSQPVDYHSVV